MLSIKNINKSFIVEARPKTILDAMSLTVEKGEFVSLIGPSGSGKSTLFQIIGGTLQADSGQIIIDEKVVNGQSGHISYMPQQSTLLPWYTVEKNIQVALEVAGISKKEAIPLIYEALEQVGLLEYKDAYPHMLSGGMSQRISFIRALLAPQQLMLLDEPFGALDALTRINMQKWLLEVWGKRKKSVLLITHSIDEALMLSDRIYVMSQTPAQIVAEFKLPFKRPREDKLWTTEQFNQLKDEIYQLLV